MCFFSVLMAASALCHYQAARSHLVRTRTRVCGRPRMIAHFTRPSKRVKWHEARGVVLRSKWKTIHFSVE